MCVLGCTTMEDTSPPLSSGTGQSISLWDQLSSDQRSSSLQNSFSGDVTDVKEFISEPTSSIYSAETPTFMKSYFQSDEYSDPILTRKTQFHHNKDSSVSDTFRDLTRTRLMGKLDEIDQNLRELEKYQTFPVQEDHQDRPSPFHSVTSGVSPVLEPPKKSITSDDGINETDSGVGDKSITLAVRRANSCDGHYRRIPNNANGNKGNCIYVQQSCYNAARRTPAPHSLDVFAVSKIPYKVVFFGGWKEPILARSTRFLDPVEL